MRRRGSGAVVAALIAGCGGATDGARDVDLLLVGGAIDTLDWPAPDGADGGPSPASSWTEAHGWRPSAITAAAGRPTASHDSVTVEEAIRAVTTTAIVVGRVADLTVAMPDPFRTPPAEWLEAGRITYTIVAGRVVHDGTVR